ncbi:MAG TPA: hypothetical protein PLV57_05415 [Phycisphaerae bacterium]|nr:hypothetical protein [Phycisphaerae bacterium]
MRQILGAYQLLTGGFGALYHAVLIVRAGGASLGGLVFVGLFALVAYAGYALLKNRSNGPQLTLVAQALQSVQISSSSFAYRFVAGLAFWVTLGSTGLGISGLDFGAFYRWMTASTFGTTRSAAPFTVGINLIAAAIVVWLLYWSGSKKKRR